MGRLEYETDPIGKKFHYSYHPNGKVKEKYNATNLPETLLITYYWPPGTLGKFRTFKN